MVQTNLEISDGVITLIDRSTGESKLLLNIHDTYTNFSVMSRETHFKLLNQILLFYKQLNLSQIDCTEQFVLHSLFIRLLSESNQNQNLLICGNESLIEVFSQYCDGFRKGNLIYTVPLNESEDLSLAILEYMNELVQTHENFFSLIQLPYNCIKNNIEQIFKVVSDMLKWDGFLILSGCLHNEFSSLPFKITEQYRIDEIKSVILLNIDKEINPGNQYLEKISQLKLMLSSIQQDLKKMNQVDIVNQSILTAAKMENNIVGNEDTFLNHNLKYQVNELKNALLDLRYDEKEENDIFIKTIKELCNELITEIK